MNTLDEARALWRCSLLEPARARVMKAAGNDERCVEFSCNSALPFGNSERSPTPEELREIANYFEDEGFTVEYERVDDKPCSREGMHYPHYLTISGWDS